MSDQSGQRERPHQWLMPNRRSLLRAVGAGALAAAAPTALKAPEAAAAAPTAKGPRSTRPASAAWTDLPLVGGEEFPIGLWWPPPPFQTTLERYQEIKDAGFTFTHSNNYLWADHHIQRRALEMAHQVGLQLVIDDSTIRWLRNDFEIRTDGEDFTLTPEQAATKIRQVVDLYRPLSYWRLEDGHLLQDGGSGAGSVGLSRAGADWTDYTFAFDTAPRQTGGGGTYAQAGWAFRAQDPANTYVWLLANAGYSPEGAPGYLAKALFVNGSPVWVRAVPLDIAVTPDTWYHVETTVNGNTITTSINGDIVDTTTDETYRAGKVGFREAGPESARFDNVVVTAADGTQLLADDFSGTLAAWDPPNAGGYPSFVGLDVYDEPSPDKFETLARIVEIMREEHPEFLPYINLFPSTDRNYVRQFVEVVKPALISFDRYPLLADGSDDPHYFLNWAIVREEGLRANLPTWIFIQTLAYANHREPTEAELLWQINVSLAYGCKGIQYFTYWTPDPARGEAFESALITVDGRRTARYDFAKKINTGWLAPVGRELKPLVSESVVHANEDPLPEGAIEFTPNDYVRQVSGGAVILGQFRSTDTEETSRWLLVVNRAHSKQVTARLTMNRENVTKVYRFDPAHRRYEPLHNSAVVDVKLPPGAAALYKLRTS